MSACAMADRQRPLMASMAPRSMEVGVLVPVSLLRCPNRTHVESRIAYKMQEEAFGVVAPETRKRLEAIGARHSKIKLRAKPREFNFAPGTILLREWGEREHRVR